MAQPPSLSIPLLDSHDLVLVPVSGLPDDTDMLLEVLAAEAAPLSTWMDFAKAYLATGKEEAFKHICMEGAKEEVSEEVRQPCMQPCTWTQRNVRPKTSELHVLPLLAVCYNGHAPSIKAFSAPNP